jgi:molecular chaperone HtpG
LPKSDITDEQYQAFYQHIAHDYENPLTWTHNRVEGKTEYVNLLYIPAKQPFDLWDPKHTRGLKLYVRRVFIMDDAEQLLPRYLRFVRGIIDSNDLPLNVSREILQSSRVVDTIRQGVIKRTLGLLKTLATDKPEQYAAFWKNFGAVLKEGPGEDFSHKEEIAALLRFASTKEDNVEVLVSLADYKARMKEGQTKIYYCTADSHMAAKHSPHLESFQQNGVEVLLLTDRVDEWLMAHLTEFEGLSFQSVARGQLDEGKKVDETVGKTFEASLSRVKTLLQDKVKDVRLTERLTQSPACIVADETDMNLHMERILRSMGQAVESKPILELNPAHPLVQLLQTEANESRFADLSHLLLEQAIVAEGGQLPDPGTFVKRVNRWLLEGLVV